MASAAAGHASTRRTNKSEARKTIPGFLCFMGAFGGIRTRVYTRPQGRESNKDSRPVRSTTDSHEGGTQHDLNVLRRGARYACDFRSRPQAGVSDMPFGQDGQQPRELGESKVDMKRVQTKSPRFEPSNPLTIMPCTSRNVKSSRVGKAARTRRRDGRAAVPSRSCRPVGSCHDCATSRSCSRRIGTRIRAGVRRIPLP